MKQRRRFYTGFDWYAAVVDALLSAAVAVFVLVVLIPLLNLIVSLTVRR